MEVLGAVRLREVEKAQQEIVAIARKLEEEGLIVDRRGRRGGVCRLGRGVRRRRRRRAVRLGAVAATGAAPRRRVRRVPRAGAAAAAAPAQRRGRRRPQQPAPRAGGARARGVRQGLRAGRARRRRGRRQARRSDAAPRRPRRSRSSAALRAELIQQTERQMVQLALALARRVVHREVTLDPRARCRAWRASRSSGSATTAPATIRLHPEDYAAIVAARGAPLGRQRRAASSPIRRCRRGGCLRRVGLRLRRRQHRRAVRRAGRALLGDDAEPHADATRRDEPPESAASRSTATSTPREQPTRCRSSAASCATVGLLVESRGPRARVGESASCRRAGRAAAAGRGRRLPRRPSADGAARRHRRHPARRPHRRARRRARRVPVGAGAARPRDRRRSASRSTASGRSRGDATRAALSAAAQSAGARSDRRRRWAPACAPSTRC